MTTMLERCAAKALETAASHPGQPYIRQNDDLNSVMVDGDVDFVAIARAVIEALMEPTPEMVEAGAKGSGEDSPAVAEGAWDAMLRAALGDEDAG